MFTAAIIQRIVLVHKFVDHILVYQLFLILLRSCGTYATFLMHSGFAVARLVAAAFLDEETLGDEAGEEVGEAVLVST